MQPPLTLAELCGWILPNGEWVPTEAWWHVSKIYDLKDEGLDYLNSNEIVSILNEGDEEKIKKFVYHLHFIRVSQNVIDGKRFNKIQLKTLQSLVSYLDPTIELHFYSSPQEQARPFTVRKIMLLKNPDTLIRTI